jgi:hypothetical protein
MSLSFNKNIKFHQGIYKPKNQDKYVGFQPPFYRSSIEAKFMKFCDDNPNVIKWSSETITVPYFDKVKRKSRTYYVDNYVEIIEGSVTKKYLVELKDHRETQKPNPKSSKKKATLLYEQATWLTNTCKWKAAHEFSKQKGLEFLLLGYSQKDGFSSVKLDFLI